MSPLIRIDSVVLVADKVVGWRVYPSPVQRPDEPTRFITEVWTLKSDDSEGTWELDGDHGAAFSAAFEGAPKQRRAKAVRHA